MTDVMQAALTRLSHVQGVRGAMIVDPEAGVPVTAELAADVDGKAVAALAGSLFRRAGQAVSAAGQGALSTVQLEAAGGHVVASGSEALLVVVLAEAEAQLGLIRVEAQRAVEELQ